MPTHLSALEYLVLQSVHAVQADAQTPAMEAAIAAHTPTINAQLIRGYLVRFESAGYLRTTREHPDGWTACCTEEGRQVLHAQRNTQTEMAGEAAGDGAHGHR